MRQMKGHVRSNRPGLLAMVFASLFMVMCTSNQQEGDKGSGDSGSGGGQPASQTQPAKQDDSGSSPPAKQPEPAAENPPAKQPEPAVPGQKNALEISFEKSLHHTGEGMRYWYEKDDGFMGITGIPYVKLDCGTCHTKNCASCHGTEKPVEPPPAIEMTTCLKCHTRAKVTMDTDKKNDCEDVHFKSGMGCSDCHKVSQMHGDGKAYSSMRSPENPRIECLDCHKDGDKAFNATTRSHAKHKDDLACNACHVNCTMSCYNCHFDTFLATGSRKGTFIPNKESLLLVSYKGKVTSGIGMSLVHEGKPFVAYAPYYTHSIMKKGRACGDCHKNEAVTRMKAGEQVPMTSFADGKVVAWKGVVPLVKGKISWTFFDKTDGGWSPLPAIEFKEQFAAFAEPLTESQLKKLGMTAKSR
jgi:hypothetical protein